MHLDVKPANTLIHLSRCEADQNDPNIRDVFEDDFGEGPFSAEMCEMRSLPVYKIADLGNLGFADGSKRGEIEGDSR